MSKPVWQMVRDAIDHFGREVSYSEIRQFIWEKKPDANSSTITCHIILCSVNHPSRIHYPENKKPRLANNRYDFLYHTKRGRVCPYDVERHGDWEIYEKEEGNLGVRMCREATGEAEVTTTDNEQSGTFALESHLRDYLARNLNKIADFGAPLELFVDEDGVDGVEYQTDVGPIDILARTEDGHFYVFELKLGRGPDAALGQILRYMGWVDKHLSGENQVRGIVLASDISEKLKYAVTQIPNVELFEYELSFSVKPIDEV